jgi:hypothetical protein
MRVAHEWGTRRLSACGVVSLAVLTKMTGCSVFSLAQWDVPTWRAFAVVVVNPIFRGFLGLID